MTTYTEALARAYYETQQTCGIIPIDVQQDMMDRALKAHDEGCNEDGIYYRALLAAAVLEAKEELEHTEQPKATHSTHSTYTRRRELLNKMRHDIEIHRDKLNSHKRNTTKRAYYNRSIQLIEELKCCPREHPFDNDRIDRLPRFIERRYIKEFMK